MKIQLRDYQFPPALQAMELLPLKKVLVQMPTGGGKTHVAAWLAEENIRRAKNVWFLAHRQELIDHAARVCDAAGLPRGTQDESGISFSTVAGIGRLADLPPPDVLVFDECHHVPATSWGAVIETYPSAQVLGLTATPYRLDGKPLADYFDELICGPSTRQLIETGELSRYRYFAPALPDLKNVAVNRNEYDRAAINEIMTGSAVVGDVVEHYRRHAEGRTAILFAVSVKASVDLAARFTAAGIAAAHLDAETPTDEREALLAKLASGEIKVLSNVELLTEGIDIPSVGAVILMRPTKSLTLFRQMVGRGLRYVEDAPPLVILDHAGLYADHGAPDADYVWPLDGKPPRRTREIEGESHRSRRCTQCCAVHEWSDACPECGHEYGPHERVTTEIGGELVEVGVTIEGGRYETRHAFAERVGVNPGTVFQWMKKGLPNVATGPHKNCQRLVEIVGALDWVRENAKNYVEQGYENITDFAKRIGRESATVFDWANRGLPINNSKKVHIEAGLKWVEQSITYAPRIAPEGFMTVRDFARLVGRSSHNIGQLKKVGLPTDETGNFVDPWCARRWLDERESLVAKVSGEIINRERQRPGVREKMLAGLASRNQDPEYKSAQRARLLKQKEDPAFEKRRSAAAVAAIKKKAAATRAKKIEEQT